MRADVNYPSTHVFWKRYFGSEEDQPAVVCGSVWQRHPGRSVLRATVYVSSVLNNSIAYEVNFNAIDFEPRRIIGELDRFLDDWMPA